MQDCWRQAYRHIELGQEDQAIAVCETPACAATLECQRYLGWVYYQRNDFDKALSWFDRAAQAGDADALFGLGSIHFVRREFDTARRCYERAAEQQYPRAYGWLAYIHHQGLGVTRNVDLAVEYYKKAAAQGYLVAERALIHIAFQRGSLFDKVRAIPRFFYILGKAFFLAKRDIADPRIADIPNAFEKSKP
jgi:TPR repeat protein